VETVQTTIWLDVTLSEAELKAIEKILGAGKIVKAQLAVTIAVKVKEKS
jgi:hypothetical protein